MVLYNKKHWTVHEFNRRKNEIKVNQKSCKSSDMYIFAKDILAPKDCSRVKGRWLWNSLSVWHPYVFP